MIVRVVRATARSTASLDAKSVLPRFHKAAGPNPTAGFLGATLSVLVLPFRVSGPIERKAVGDEPLPNIRAWSSDRANRNHSAIMILPRRGASNWARNGVKQPCKRRGRRTSTLVQ